MSYLQNSRTKVTVSTLQKMRDTDEKIAMLTCYDASFAQQMDMASVDILLVGDSLGNVVQGQQSTLPVSLVDMLYHTRCVARGSQNCFIMADMPFGTYPTKEEAYHNALLLMQAGAHMVKMEGGSWLLETVDFLQKRAIPVCAHLGLMPQSVNVLGGFKVQGKTDAQAQKLLEETKLMEEAGAQIILFEAIPASLAKQATESVRVPTIGIGAGVDCSGQVLVTYDMLDISVGKKPKFVKNFLEDSSNIQEAIKRYVDAVKQRVFPDDKHLYN